MELNAKIIELLPVQSGTSSKGSWEKNQFVVEWSDNGYTQKLCLEVMGADKWEKMKNAAVVGHDVLVKFNVTSREYNGRWFTTASCYYCSTIGGQQAQQGAQTAAAPNIQSAIPPTPSQQDVHVDDDSLPF